jgi:hypothetical protein
MPRYLHIPHTPDTARTLTLSGRNCLAVSGMLMDLQELLGREVDLVEEGSLRPYAAETANRDKILIYERKSKG